MAKSKSKKKDEPVSEVTDEAQAPADPFEGLEYPCTVLVAKGGDKIPKIVGNRGELDRLVGEHGASAVEVQS